MNTLQVQSSKAARGIMTSKLLYLLKMGQFKMFPSYFISSRSIKSLTISLNKSRCKEERKKKSIIVLLEYGMLTSFELTYL
jgi:hypothetical protein